MQLVYWYKYYNNRAPLQQNGFCDNKISGKNIGCLSVRNKNADILNDRYSVYVTNRVSASVYIFVVVVIKNEKKKDLNSSRHLLP